MGKKLLSWGTGTAGLLTIFSKVPQLSFRQLLSVIFLIGIFVLCAAFISKNPNLIAVWLKHRRLIKKQELDLAIKKKQFLETIAKTERDRK